MKAEDVILQLYSKLPSKNAKFSNSFVPVSITAVGTTATVNAPLHGLQTGHLISVNGADAPLNIANLTRSGTVGTVETVNNHDFTFGYQQTITIDQANEPEFNGQFQITAVPNRRFVEFTMPDAGPTVATGSPVVIGGTAFGYNGLFQITVIDADNFEYTIPQPVDGDAFGSPEITSGFRITGAVSFERAAEAYTRQQTDDYWIFVVLGNVFASKDRHTLNDSILTKVGSETWKQQIIQPFTVYVFAPATATIAARSIRDEMEDIAAQLFGCLLGTKFDTYLKCGAYYQTVFSSHGFQDYDTAVYAHAFNFQSTAEIVFDDTVGEGFNVAFRDIDLELATHLMTPDTTRLTVGINLDDEPLP